MKRVIAVLSVICMLLFGGVAFADEPQSNASAQLDYMYEGKYVVNIPQTIQVGSPFTVTANVNLMGDKEVVVSFDEFEHSDRIKLKNETSSDTVDVQFHKQDGTVYCNNDNVIATFDNNTNDVVHVIGTTADHNEDIKAGNYFGSVDFLIDCRYKSY